MKNFASITKMSHPVRVNQINPQGETLVDPTKNPVRESKNYDDFEFLINNRDRRHGHIENLKKAFEISGNLTQVQPILVNERMEIIDGQHRFYAAKELGLPIYYTVVPGLGINDARQMNILHKSWDLDDYAASYADGGDANYKRYLELKEDYGFSHSIILTYINGDEKKGAQSGFRAGEFTLSPDEVLKARERLDHLTDVAEQIPMASQKEFAVALLKCMNVADYDTARMVNKLQYSHDIPKYASVLDYQRALEDIYNWKSTDANRTRLF